MKIKKNDMNSVSYIKMSYLVGLRNMLKNVSEILNMIQNELNIS